jgi:membrane protease subunit HflK
MFQPGGPRQPEVDFDQLLAGVKGTIGSIAARLGGGGVGGVIVLAIALIAVLWLASGIYRIGPGEEVAQRRFGAICGAALAPCSGTAGVVTQTGLHWWWPGPIGKTDKIKVTETRRMELGFRSGADQGVADVQVPVEGLMISGDLNIVDVQMVVQYDIKDLVGFLFRVNDPGEDARGIPAGNPEGRTLKDAAEAALRLVVGQRSIEDVLTEQRTAVESDTKTRLQDILDNYQTGINIVSLQLLKTQAPEEVFESFEDVLRARQEQETRVNEALAYKNNIIPRAQGDAERIKREAEAFAQARVARARGESSRFISVLEQFRDHSIELGNVLQDTNDADGDGDPATGIGLGDVTMIDGPDVDGDGIDILVSSLTLIGAELGEGSECLFTNADAADGDSAVLCTFSVGYDGQNSALVSGTGFSIAYLGNEILTLPSLVGTGPFEMRLNNPVLDTDNADGDDNVTTGISAADIEVVQGPDGGKAQGVDISVNGFDTRTNVVSFRVQKGEILKAGDGFTVQYLNRENLKVPATSEVTQQRLYLEAIETILPEINKIIVSPDTESVIILGGRDGITPIPVGPSQSPVGPTP